MISNSGQDENKKYYGGKAGDQTGNEWVIKSWYNKSWDCILRHPDEKVRDLIGDLAEESANNDLIGYDQAQRTTFWTQLKKADYRPKNITVACEADCSAGVSALVKAVGYLLNDAKLKKVGAGNTTSTLRKALKSAGFEVLTDSKYLTSDKYLLRGDIILKEGSHVCTNLTDGSATKVSATKEYIKKAQDVLNQYIDAGLAVDGDIGKLTRKATAKALQYTLNRQYGTVLVMDGVINDATLEALKGKYVSKSSRSYLVSWGEIALMLLGYYTSTIEFKGYFGVGMDKAVRAFQADNSLTVDGSMGEKTIKKIISALGL